MIRVIYLARVNTFGKQNAFMKIPVWKKWWSYVTPVVLEMTGSEQNPELSVLLNQGRIQLLSGNAVYSWDDLYRNFKIAFEKVKIQDRKIDEVLILGLGLGSIPFMLEKNFGRDYYYTAVEWDETVADLASRYTLSRLKSAINVVVADAELFVDICEERFDMLIVDVFEDDLTPPHFKTAEFLQACYELMNPGGLLLFNCLYGDHKDIVAADRFMERVFQVAFPLAWRIDTGGNMILCYERLTVDG